MYRLLALLQVLISISPVLFTPAFGQHKLTGHRTPSPNEVPVTGPGSYGKPGKTYILVNDITSAQSTVFLGKDVILDLNGYTIRYANGDYEHIPNSGFEEGERGWDLSRHPVQKW